MGSELGTPFGNFTLLERVAQGGMAEVFVAQDQHGHLVAVKRMLPHLIGDQSFIRMFQNEARLAAQLSHPNIISIVEYGSIAEHFFIAMEFMHSVHLGELIRLSATSPIPPELAAKIAVEACKGLHYAHHKRDPLGVAMELVHRDISPPNILVSFDGAVKLVDFGIAKAASSMERTLSGVVKGKYAYMSPEQTMGHRLDGRSDVFSLGLVLWELLAGRVAVTRSDQILAMQTIRDGRVPNIETVRDDIPRGLVQALAGALRKDPAERSDAQRFGEDLERFLLHDESNSGRTSDHRDLGMWVAHHFAQKFKSPPKALQHQDSVTRLLPTKGLNGASKYTDTTSTIETSPVPVEFDEDNEPTVIAGAFHGQAVRPMSAPPRRPNLSKWALLSVRAKWAVGGTILSAVLIGILLGIATSGEAPAEMPMIVPTVQILPLYDAGPDAAL